MASLVTDSNGVPTPQYIRRDGTAFEMLKGNAGAMDVNLVTPVPAGENILGIALVVPTRRLSAVAALATPARVAGSPNDSVVFADMQNSISPADLLFQHTSIIAYHGVQLFVKANAAIIAAVLEAKIDANYFPIITVVPDSASGITDALSINSMASGIELPTTWRLRLIMATNAANTAVANYQYITA